MGKKVKAKAKNPRKAQPREQPAAATDTGSGDAAPPDASNPGEEATVSARDREQCGHYIRDSAYLDKVLLEIMSSKHTAACEHCREDTPRKRGGGGGKERGGKQQKKKGGGGGARGAAAKVHAKVENSGMWVCLDCNRHFCGGAVDDAKPYGHARRHSKQDRHWWAAQYNDPTVAYCFSCDKEVSIEMPKVETMAAVTVDDKVVGATDGGMSGLANWHSNVIKGLPNIGNTCFFNAVLQSLLALDRLRRKMLEPDVPAGPLSMSLRKLFMESSVTNDAGGTLSPKNLFSAICSKYPQFKGHQMQDSHELLRCFLDGLRTEETETRKLSEDITNVVVPTIVDSTFEGQLSSTVSSKECTHSSVKHDQFLDLSLPLPSRRPPAKSVASPPPKRTKQSIRERGKSRKYAKISTRVSPTIKESNKEKIQTVAECNDSQIPGSELGQVVSEKEAEPSEHSESCASVPNQEQKTASNVEDDICWLDYLADADETKSEILDSADSTEAGQIWQSKDVIHDSMQTRDDDLPKEQVLSSERSSENIVDDAAPLQSVILLPYKEFDATADDMDGTAENSQNPEGISPPAVSPVAENNEQAACGGDVEQDDYVGLGDMFNEPEVTSEVKKEAGTVEDIDVMAWSTNSADDEVDDSNAPVSVEGCLSLYTEPELLAEPWHCEHCSGVDACLNTNEGKDGEDMMARANGRKDGGEIMASANERKDGEEMMESGDERHDGEQLIAANSKGEDGDQIMASVGCSDNVNSGIQCKEERSTKPSLADSENTYAGDPPDTGNATSPKTSTHFDWGQIEQSDSKTYPNEQSRDFNSSAVECTSLSKQPDGSAFQHNVGQNVDITAEETSAALSCDKDSASCSTTNNKQPECAAGVEEAATSSLPADKQRSLSSAKDNEDAIIRNQDRRKRMRMVGKAHQVQDNQDKQEENKTKVFRAAMRRILISKAPPVLTINLNRFSQDSHGRFKKLKGHVRFKEMLDIRPFMDPRSKENDNTSYRLVGVVEHLGTMSTGHYVAYVRAGKIGGRPQASIGSKSWFYASDGHVREVSLEEVLKCEAYILFYERMGG